MGNGWRSGSPRSLDRVQGMSTLLLRTKLHVPPVRQELVSRPRLLEQLDLGLHRKLVLVSAPAGFGKTTLLSEWIARRQRPVAWVSLDKGDDDPMRFWTHAIAALQTFEPKLAADLLTGFEAGQLPPLEMLLTSIINQLNALRQEYPVIVVLDDYHLIENPAIHRSLTFLVDHQPPQMCLVIASRADPPLPLPRLRARGEMVELRQNDLRFTMEEASALVNKVMGLALTSEDVAALDARTEGWIAGLQMAAVSMQARVQTDGRQALSRFIEAFTGSHRFILDYLVEEVLDQQQPAVQEFLLKTSILDQLTGDLCDAILHDLGDREKEPKAVSQLSISDSPSALPGARSPSQRLLEQLDSANLFIIPLDEERVWYRYHRLFSDLLRRRLVLALPEQVPVLHRRASQWYEQAGLAAKAIDHALSAGDFDRAASLIEEEAEGTLKRSEVATLLGWMEQLPDDKLRARPALVLLRAWALLMGGRSLDAVALCMKDVERHRESMPGQVAAIRGYHAILRGEVSTAAGHSEQALRDLPGDALLWRSLAVLTLSTCQLTVGDLEASNRALNEIVRVGRASGNVLMGVGALIDLARFRIRRGRLGEAKAIYDEALELASAGQAQPLPIASQALVGLGNLAREWNDLKAANRYLQEGIALAREWSALAVIDGLVALAHVRQALGDEVGASQAMREASHLARQSDATELDDLYVDMQQARLWVMQGNLEAAARWLEERGLGDSTRTALPAPRGATSGTVAASGSTDPELGEALLEHRLQKYERLVLAHLLVRQGQSDQALAVLDPLLAKMEERKRHDLALRCQVLRALVLQAQGNTALAMVALEQALSLATQGGFVRVFVDEGEPMLRLLREAASRGLAPEFVDKLLAAFDLTDLAGVGEGSPRPRAQPLVEPLSERELEVLGLLAAGLSNPEIAQELVIAVSTVRSHLKNIYGKLDVHRRWDAVQRAGELGLL
jgi:LuxR family maltose regulon positive regulatory protein